MKICSSFDKHILLAPNAFKGSLKAEEFCQVLSEELQSSTLKISSYPMCDGGDGTANIIASYWKAQPIAFTTIDALGRTHEIIYYISGNTAILDLATICGIQYLKPQEYNIYQATTAGLGKVLFHLSKQPINHIILGVGGSASIDGGLGALVEMGLKIVKRSDRFKNHLIDIMDIDIIQLKDNFKHIRWTILCDVENPLCGPEGAALTFGPQKGASPYQIALLDKKLQRYAQLLFKEKAKDLLVLKHGGAAGGIAAAFYALFGAELISGAEYCLEISNIKQELSHADWVITGEGKLDDQSLNGKLLGVLSSLCQQYHIPLIAIAGSIVSPLPHFEHLYSFLDYAPNLEEAICNPPHYLRQIAKNLKTYFLKL